MTHGKRENSCSYIRDLYDTKRVIWVKERKCAAKANHREPIQTIATINKAVFFHILHRGNVKPEHIQTGLC